MIAPLSSRPFHRLRLESQNLIDLIASIFFDIIACLNSRWKNYSKYYEYRAKSRAFTLRQYPNEIVQISLNALYPGKEAIASAPDNSHDKDYEPIAFPQNEDHLIGLCAGMCMDYMNRVRNSKKPFWGTIKELGTKFSKGSTKKGYLNQHAFDHIRLSVDHKTRLKEKLSKDDPNLQKMDLDLSLWINNILHLYLFADRMNFTAKNYLLKLSGWFYFDENLPNGDYILLIEYPNNNEPSHAICIFKRNEGSVVFDPNYGTLYFNNEARLNEFIKNSSKVMFKSDNSSFVLYKAKDHESA